MNLYERLNEIERKVPLTKELKLCVRLVSGNSVEGYYDGYTDALNNEPEITQLEIRRFRNATGTTSFYETEIDSIEII